MRAIHEILDKYAPEGIPFPSTRLYSWLVRSRFMRDFYRRVASEVAGEIQEGKILDVGTGPGYLPVEIAHLIPDVEVMGIDISGDMVRIARNNAERAGVSDRVKFKVEDANNMSFEDDSFDLALSTGAFHHWKNPVRVLNEIHRVLRRGSQAWIYDLRGNAHADTIRKLGRRYGYGKLTSLVLYSAIKAHSSITVQEVLTVLRDARNKFTRYEVEEKYSHYPILKIKLIKE